MTKALVCLTRLSKSYFVSTIRLLEYGMFLVYHQTYFKKIIMVTNLYSVFYSFFANII